MTAKNTPRIARMTMMLKFFNQIPLIVDGPSAIGNGDRLKKTVRAATTTAGASYRYLTDNMIFFRSGPRVLAATPAAGRYFGRSKNSIAEGMRGQ